MINLFPLINIGLFLLLLLLMALGFLFVIGLFVLGVTSENPIKAHGKRTRRAIDKATRDFLSQVNAQLSNQEERDEEHKPPGSKSSRVGVRTRVRGSSTPDGHQ